ncbi:ligand-gated ion channel [soil metagenome]
MQFHLPGLRWAIYFLGLFPTTALLAQVPPSASAPSVSPVPLSQTVLLAPPPSEGPIVIQAGFQLLDINAIEDQAETFEFSGILTLRWKDPRQAFDPAVEGVKVKFYQGNYQFNELSPGWYPEVVLLNVAGMLEKNGVLFRIEPDGTSTLVEGINAVAKARLKLRRYPFDRQQLNAVFSVLGYSDREVVMEAMPQADLDLARIRVPQWELQKVASRVGKGVASLQGSGPPSTYIVEFDLRRRFMFVMRLVVLPLFLVVALSWSVFWMDRSSIGDRMSVSFVSLLTVVAYQIVLGDILPRIAYLTIINLFLNFSFILVCATILVNLVVGEFDRSGQTERGNLLDLRCRRIFPFAYVALIILAFIMGFVFF